MKRFIFLIKKASFFLLVGVSIHSCSNSNKLSIKIGTQTWMTENLSVSEYNNGDSIPYAKDIEEWIMLSEKEIGCWTYYKQNGIEITKYGKLYNWFAINDTRGIAPKGWMIPQKEDLEILIDNVGGTLLGGKHLKSIDGWDKGMDKMGGNGDNSSGFNANSSGLITTRLVKDYSGIGKKTGFWSQTTHSTSKKDHAVVMEIKSLGDFAMISGYPKSYGFYVRCIKK